MSEPELDRESDPMSSSWSRRRINLLFARRSAYHDGCSRESNWHNRPLPPGNALNLSDDYAKGSPAIPGGPSQSKPAWSRT